MMLQCEPARAFGFFFICGDGGGVQDTHLRAMSNKAKVRALGQQKS